MPDDRFFKKAAGLSLEALCHELKLTAPSGAQSVRVDDVSGLNEAGPTDISFLDNKKYISALAETKAGVVVIEERYADRLPEETVALVSPTPYRTFALISQYFYPTKKVTAGIADGSHIDPTATIGTNVEIAPGAIVGANCVIGDDAYIGPNAVIDESVVIGSGTRVGAGSYLGFCMIGKNVNIHPGVRIGTRGFGFAMDRQGHIDVPQLGRVLVGNGVEIGANSTIDRGMGPDTEIGDGTKIDNLVQIGHNVKIGKRCVIVAMCGIAGSSVLEDDVILAAKVGIAGHLTIGRGAQIAAMSGIVKNVPPGSKMGGIPAVPLAQWLRERMFINKLMKKKD